jgi:hypothetical protein
MRWEENAAEGLYALDGGMHSGISPSLIGANQVAFAHNVTFRGGFARTRPKFQRISIEWEDEEARQWFGSYPVSGQDYFKNALGTQFLVCCAGGRFFSFELRSYTATAREITPEGPRWMPGEAKTWFCQALQYLVAQNGRDQPLIYNGTSSRYADATRNEVPCGRQMAYLNNRLFVVDTSGTQILAGDLGNMTANSVLEFTEISRAAADGGLPLQMPVQLGAIKGLVTTAMQDTAAGQGSLLVAANNAVSSLNPVTQRSQWPSIQLQAIALIGSGFCSDGMAVVNGDVWGRSPDGWRSYVMARREFGEWGNTPQSREIERVLQYDDPRYFEFADCVYFDNRLLMTVNPQHQLNGCYHRGLVALNFDNLSTLTGKSQAAYDGLWTGIQPYGFCSGEFGGEERCFAFCASSAGNELVEITKKYGDDHDENGWEPRRIDSFIETRAFSLGKPDLKKAIAGAEVWIDELRGAADFDLKYRPDQWPCWLDWHTWSEFAQIKDCDGFAESCGVPREFSAQYRPRMNLPQPVWVANPLSHELMSHAYEWQLRLAWTGQTRLRMLRLLMSERDVNASLAGGG